MEGVSPDFEEKPTASELKAAIKMASQEGKKKKNKGSGKYSQLVIDAIRTLGERNGSSHVKIYNEAKKVSWFDQQNGRTYLKYSLRALVLNGTLVRVRGLGASGSFKLSGKFKANSKSPSKPNKEPTKSAGDKDKKNKSLKSVKMASQEGKKKHSKESGKYSQLVIDAIRTLGERNGSSHVKIYNEAKKVSWFDQMCGRTYLRRSLRDLVLDGTLVQVCGLGANGSFKLSRKFKANSKSPSKPNNVPTTNAEVTVTL